MSTPAGTSTCTVRLRADPALAGAGRARVGDDRAVAAAGAARARGHDVAEQRTHGALDGPGSAADVAGDGLGARRAARALAGLAQDRGVDLDLALGAEHDLVEVDLDAQERVLAALPARTRSGRATLGRPEEGLEDVAEPERAAAVAEAGLRAEVVALALLGVAQHVVGVRHELEALGRLLARVDVRMQLARELPVRLLDLVRGRRSLDAQHLVMVSQVLCLSLVRRRAAGSGSGRPRGRRPCCWSSPYGSGRAPRGGRCYRRASSSRW